MRELRSRTISSWLFVLVTGAVAACGGSGNSGDPGGNGAASNGGNGGSAAAGAGTSAGGSGGAGAGAGGTAGAGTGAGPLVEAPCANHTYQCGDTLDNDGDGLADWQDPDCLGPCDNTEDSYFGGIPGQEGPACTVECYWDQDSGPGNDACYWTHRCDPNEAEDPGHPEPNAACPYDPDAKIPSIGADCEDMLAAQSDTCHEVCGPLTPNGCDCFGCCELPAGTGKFVWVGSVDEATKLGSCTLADVNDPTKCEPCIPVPSCYNDCGPCELCIGKKPEDIPDWCDRGSGGGGAGGNGSGGGGAGGGGSQQCRDGLQPCGLPGQDLCGEGFYCITGCCQAIVEPK